MLKIKSFLSIIVIFSLFLAGCGDKNSDNNQNSTSNSTSDTQNSSTSQSSTTSFISDVSQIFTDRDYEVGFDEQNSTAITFSNGSASCNSKSVIINDNTVVINNEGTYVLSGKTDNSTVIVNANENDKVHLILNGVSITGKTSAAIYILEADKVFITLAQGTENTLTNGGSFEAIDENNIDAVIFSKQDLTFNGSGTLTVTSPVGHGIVCKDDLVFTSGSFNITSASHAVDANDSIRITNTNFVLDAGKDGFHAENNDDSSLGYIYIESGSFDIEAEGDGVSANAFLQIESGTFNITAGGGSVNSTKTSSDSYGGFMGRPNNKHEQSQSSSATEDSTSMKALKATQSMLIKNGSFTIDSADDAVHSNTSITVDNGKFEISTGDDGFHADEALTINGGEINIAESYEGLEGLNITVTGGSINIISSDDGINAAGGNDQSGTGGRQPGGDMFGKGPGGMGSSSSNGSIAITGGSIYMNASGDGIDANGTFTMSGGTLTVCGPTSGDTAVLDYDISATITGGTFIGTGAYQMAQTFSDSTQGVVAVRVGNQAAGTSITLTDKNGNNVITYNPKLSFQIVILSTPDMIKGEEYTITVGSVSGEFEAN